MKPRRFVRTFQPQFAAAVERGEKRRTIRQMPVRIPEPGDTIDCRAWTGKPYDSPQRKLREGTITKVALVQILDHGCNLSRGVKEPVNDLDVFARADGFPDWLAMRGWFAETHGLPFTGLLIEWQPDIQ